MYQFFLYHREMKRPKRIPDPVGWDTLGKEYKRDPKYYGLFFEYTPKLQFIKEGRAIIHYFYERDGIESEITLLIYKKDTSSRRMELYWQGRVNLTSLEVTPLYAACNVEQTGFVQSFKNAMDVKVNIAEGGTLTQELHSRVIQRESKSKILFGDTVSDLPFNSPDTLYLIFTTEANEADELGERFDYGTQISTENPVELSKYIFLLKEGGSYAFNINAGFTLIANDDGFNFVVQWKIVYGKPGAYTTVNVGPETSAAGTNLIAGLSQYAGTLDMEKDDEVYVFAEVDLSGNPGSLSLSYLPLYNPNPGEEEDIVYSHLYVSAATVTPATSASGVLWHEAFSRIVTKNTGRANAFQSAYYGREDNGYDADGDGALKLLLSGALIRGFSASEKGLYISFKDLIEASMALDGVTFGIEKVNNREVVVVDKLSHFFAPRLITRLANVRDIKKVVADEFYYNQIDGGYDKWSDEQIANLDEFNAKREFKTPITQIGKKLDLRCKIIAGGYPIENIRRDHITLSETKDNDRDNEHFVVCLVRTEDGYDTERNQGGIGAINMLNVSTAYNLRLSPMQNLLRNGELVKSGLYKVPETSKIVLSYPEGNANFQSIANFSLLSEKEVTIDKLGKSLWIPEFYEFKTKLTMDIQRQIEADPYGYIEFAPDERNWKRGYIWNVKPDSKSDLTTFKLLRANL
jgi:hypothetical protein